MPSKARKALSMPMEIIIAVVVLVVIALAVIMCTTGGITKGGDTAMDTQTTAGEGLACQSEITAYCAKSPTASTVTCSTTTCPSCTAGTYSCGL